MTGLASAQETPTTSAPAEAKPAESMKPVEELSLDYLLNVAVAQGEAGSFGTRLEKLDTSVFLHAYLTLDYYNQNSQHSFDAHYFNVFVGGNVADRLFPEVQVELEHGNEFAVRFAQLDVKLHEAFIVRSGLFLVPFGLYNEFLYPEYLTKLPRSPLVLFYRDIIPVAWNDTGVQVRGKTNLSSALGLSYAAYLVNGLEQKDAAPKDGVIVEGGGIRGMRGNFRDLNNANKAFGGRLSLDLWDETLLFGVSGYRGMYTAEGRRFLTLLGSEVLFKKNKFYFRVEGAVALQDVSDAAEPDGLRQLTKQGVYALAAYSVIPQIEPAVAFDRIVLGGRVSDNVSRFTLGVNYRPFGQSNFVTRASYTFSRPDGSTTRDDIFMIQASMGI
ncbi:MAG: hypothetical protein ACOZIN_02695 [Myxococcota bacterium]